MASLNEKILDKLIWLIMPNEDLKKLAKDVFEENEDLGKLCHIIQADNHEIPSHKNEFERKFSR